MSRVRSTNTRIEKELEKILKNSDLSFVRYYPIIGKPDFAIPDLKIAIFADSRFWHGYNWKAARDEIKTNKEFWIKKIGRNIERDKEVNKALEENGWTVIRFWEQEILEKPEECLKKILETIASKKKAIVS
jgi:DNA mismatch endonuclease (patch repair protein)